MRPAILKRTAAVFGALGLLFSPMAPLVWAGPPFSEFVDPNPAAGNQFGATVVALSTGNVVITSPFDDAGGTDAGAVYLFNGATGALISTLTGSTANDRIGLSGVTALTNGNYVVRSPTWHDGALVVGAATWGNGTTGVSGVVSASNSLVGSTTGDGVSTNAVFALPNGNYLVASQSWDNGATPNAGAMTWGNGSTGISGPVTALNSLVGTHPNDSIGPFTTILTNGNYVVRSLNWDNGVVIDTGAVTWGDATTGVSGAVSASNSLVGSTLSDSVGNGGITVLSNGNYVVRSQNWGGFVGAATWANGLGGTVGAVSAANSLVGSAFADSVGNNGITALSNGNYVVASPNWGGNVGAATWGNGLGGTVGAVSAANSLVGSTATDYVGLASVALSNGNYVVASSEWDGAAADVGAATWGNGLGGTVGAVSAANSLVGSTPGDGALMGVTALTNGNYVVACRNWDGGAANVGAATWGNGLGGTVGAVSALNSLVGSTLQDRIGDSISTLSNGNYVVRSFGWDGGAADVGAATWGNGLGGTVGAVSAANSLVGSTPGDGVGNLMVALSNGNYVVATGSWDAPGPIANVGAVTWGNGTTGISGVVGLPNSLLGGVASSGLNSVVADNTNDTFFARFNNEGGGRVRLGSQADGFVPGPPTIGIATAGNGTVSVAFTAPGSDGGSPITGYTATCSGAGGPYTGTGGVSPISVTVPNGTAVTCTVHATNGVGDSGESSPSNSATPTSGAQTVTITGGPGTIVEGTGGPATPFTFTVAKTPGPSGGTTTVTYTLTGTATTPDDYNALTGTVNLTNAVPAKSITVLIRKDTKFEPNETLILTLTGASAGYTVVGSPVTATVTNDDVQPSVRVNLASVTEGPAVSATVTVTLSNKSYLPVSVNAFTADGSAFAPGDYTTTVINGFTVPADAISATFPVPITNDNVGEAAENFQVQIVSPVNATLGSPSTSVGTIFDDESPGLSISDPILAMEGNSGTSTLTFNVTIPGLAPPGGVGFTYATSDGTGLLGATTADSDYVSTSGTVCILEN